MFHSVIIKYSKKSNECFTSAVAIIPCIPGSNPDFSAPDPGGNGFCSSFVRFDSRVRSCIADTLACQADILDASASKPGVEGVSDPLP